MKHEREVLGFFSDARHMYAEELTPETAASIRSVNERFALMQQLVVAAATMSVEMRREGLDVRTKDVRDEVSNADLTLDAWISAQIREAFPDDMIVSEESWQGNREDLSEATCWVVDPLDGSSNNPVGLQSAVGISFCVRGQPILSAVQIIERDGLGELFIAERGCNVLASVSTKPNDMALLGYDVPKDRARRLKVYEMLPYLADLGNDRGLGSMIFAGTLVANGTLGAYFNGQHHPWDIAAIALLVWQAGGVVLNEQGKDWSFKDKFVVLAANRELAETIIDAYNQTH